MARKQQENPALDMTPMIDVVFELIIFFVVTLTEAAKKDETIELEDGTHGIVITPEQMSLPHIQIDVGRNGRISIADRTVSPDEIESIIKKRMEENKEFSAYIRADYRCSHAAVARAMDACAAAGVWRISFLATGDDKTYKPPSADTPKGAGRVDLIKKYPKLRKIGGRE